MMTPFRRKRLELIHEIVQGGYNPLDVTVIQGGTSICFSAKDIALYYSQAGGTFEIVCTAQ